jgi:hypothetical protein
VTHVVTPCNPFNVVAMEWTTSAKKPTVIYRFPLIHIPANTKFVSHLNNARALYSVSWKMEMQFPSFYPFITKKGKYRSGRGKRDDSNPSVVPKAMTLDTRISRTGQGYKSLLSIYQNIWPTDRAILPTTILFFMWDWPRYGVTPSVI